MDNGSTISVVIVAARVEQPVQVAAVTGLISSTRGGGPVESGALKHNIDLTGNEGQECLQAEEERGAQYIMFIMLLYLLKSY